MGKADIRVLSIVPSARNLEPIVSEFCAPGQGIITAFSDGSLRTLRELVPEDAQVEVLPFGAVVCSFASLAGEETMALAQSGHYTAAIAAACEELPEGSPFARTAAFPGLHSALADTLGELADWGIGPQRMDDARGSAPPALAKKLESLAMIQREAERLLGELGRQLHCAHLKTCVESRPDDARFSRLLVVAGAEAQPEPLGWVRWAADCGASVTIVTYRHASGAPLFAGSAAIASLLGVSPEPVGGGGELLEALFTDGTAAACSTSVTVASAADMLAECEWAVRGCLLAHAEGVPLSQVGIFARDIHGYAPLLEAAARRLGLPLRVGRRAPLLTNSFAKVCLHLLEFCASSDVRSLAPLMKSSYFGLNRSARMEMTDALHDARRARAGQWETLRAWAEAHADDHPWLARMLDWRHEAMADPASLSSWTDRLRLLVGALPMLTSTGASHQRDLRAQSAMQRSLAHRASIQRVREPRPFTLKQFVTLCREVWEDADVSVPPGDIGVPVTGSSESVGKLRRLFVLGMLEGVFPRRRSEEPILTDKERDDLSGILGLVQPLPTSYDKARAERDEFYTVCASATDSLTFSYPQTDEQRDNVPAFYLSEVQRAAGPVVRKVDHKRAMLAPHDPECLAPADIALNAALVAERDEPLEIALRSVEAAAAIKRPDDDPAAPWELRAALQCPFSFFARHVLGIRTGRRRARWSSLRKIPQSVALVSQPTPAHARQALLAALDAELDRMVADVPEWELALLRSGGERLIDEWVHREFTARQVWPKDPGSVKPNALFGTPGLRSSMGKFGELTGSVAGLSKMEDYVVVHLVESRAPNPERGATTKLNDRDTLYFGLHLMAAYDKSGAAALEIETMGGKRVLMVLPRLPNVTLNSRVQEGLEVIDLSPSDDPSLSKRLFYEEVKARLSQAAKHIKESRIDAIKGEHCAWCDYGELCRRSSEFGEVDSPFGGDLGIGPD